MDPSQQWDTGSEDDWNIVKRKKKTHKFTPKDKEIIHNKNTSINNKTHYSRFVYNFIKEGDIGILSSTSDETNSDLENINININNNHNIADEPNIIKDRLVDTNTDDLVFSHSTLRDNDVLQLSKSFERSKHDTNKKSTNSLRKSTEKTGKDNLRKPSFLARISCSWLRKSLFIKKVGNQQNHSKNDQELTFEEMLVIFVLFFFFSLGVWKFFNLLVIVLFKSLGFISNRDKNLTYSKMSSKIITTFNWKVDLKDLQTYENIYMGAGYNDTMTSSSSSSSSSTTTSDNISNNSKDTVFFESKLYISTIPVKYRIKSKQIKETWKPQGKYLIDFDTQSIYKMDTVSIMLSFYKKLIRESKTHYDQIKSLFEKEIDKDAKRWSNIKDHVESIRKTAKKNIKTINWRKKKLGRSE